MAALVLSAGLIFETSNRSERLCALVVRSLKLHVGALQDHQAGYIRHALRSLIPSITARAA